MNDEHFAIDILPRVSRTFALSIEALPQPMRSTVRVSYLLCRVVDTIEDDPELPEQRRQQLFTDFVHLVGDDRVETSPLEAEFADWHGNDDRELCRNVGAIFRIFRSLPPALADAARPHIIEMAEGMAEYARRWLGPQQLVALEDRADLERYCYFVAGTVGNLLTAVFLTVHDLPPAIRQALEQRSVAFGLGLQMTNIVKDVTADRARGWCFLPAALCRRHGLEPEQLTDPAERQPAMTVVGEVVGWAREHLDQAVEYTLTLPTSAPEVRLFVLVPLALALSTLTLVEGSPEVLVPGEAVKITRETVSATLLRAREVIDDDDGIQRLCRQASAGEL